MDSIFGIGLPELIVILLLAGIVMGPDRIYHVAKWLGKTTAQLQAISRGFARQLSAELESIDSGGEIKNTAKEIQDLQKQLKELRSELLSAARSPVEEANAAVKEGQQLLQNSILPPKQEETEKKDEAENESAAIAPPKVLDIPDDPE